MPTPQPSPTPRPRWPKALALLALGYLFIAVLVRLFGDRSNLVHAPGHILYLAAIYFTFLLLVLGPVAWFLRHRGTTDSITPEPSATPPTGPIPVTHLLRRCLIALLVLIFLSPLFVAVGPTLDFLTGKQPDPFDLSTTKLAQYPHLLAMWRPSGLVQHFPATIPASASSARLFETPAILQGGASFQLRLTLPAAAVAEIERFYAPQTSITYQGDNIDDLINPPAPNDHTGSTGHGPFSNSFTIYVLKSHAGGEESFRWNHGETAGLAINRETHEVVYWAESW
jgi:hypothetical protein